MQQGARVIVLSHLGRPEEGKFEREYSLAPVAAQAVRAARQAGAAAARTGSTASSAPKASVVLCENVRFNKGEKKDSEALARQMAALCDVFVMDAFGTAHRAEASTHGVARFAPVACAGPLLVAELEALERALANPARPLVAIVAGSKVSTKLQVLEALLDKVDKLIVGGGIANTFLAATGINVGKSLCEKEMLDMARTLLARARARGAEIPLPIDVVVAREFAATAHADVRPVAQVADDELILDIGPDTAELFDGILRTPARSSGTARSACSSSTSLARAPSRSPTPSPAANRFRSPAAATRWRPSRSTASRTASPTSRPAVAHFLNSSKARPCRPWRCSSSGPRS